MVQEIHVRDWAGVSASQVEMTSGIQFYDGITTSEIQEILIKSASDLIDLESPNYQFVMLVFFSSLSVNNFMDGSQLPNLIDHITDLKLTGIFMIRTSSIITQRKRLRRLVVGWIIKETSCSLMLD